MARLKCPKCYHVNAEGAEVCEQCRTPLPRIRIEARSETEAPPSQEIQFRRGQVVAQRYTVLQLIGRGGMGCIYKVHDNTLGEEVALKTLLPQLARDKLVVERFFNEARIARRLAHPNIVRVHDIGTAGNIIYISMEFLEGVSLRGALERLKGSGRLPLLQTLNIVDELCAALEYAHQFTVHRDIKPENVMLGSDGRIKLMDFGISKLMADTRLTGASVVMGTPFYMAPEQLRNSRDVDARADIYSVGVMLYELLTGNVPTGVPKPLSEILKNVPPELDRILAKCVEPDPNLRYQNATELRKELAPLRERLFGASELQRRTTHVTGVAGGRLRRLLGVGLAVLVLACAGVGAVLAGGGAREEGSGQTEAIPVASAGGFDSIAEYARRAQKAAAAKSEGAEGPLRIAYQAGEEMWGQAQEAAARQAPEAVDLAEYALQCYLATLIWPSGMVFVPPGKTAVDGQETMVAPFFIDEFEVSAGNYRIFCESVPGGWTYNLPQEWLAEWPAALVSFYDAQAYAAWKQKVLPTHAQWARAAYGATPSGFPWGDTWEEGSCNSASAGGDNKPMAVASFARDSTRSGCRDMAGNVSEWTRTIAGTTPEEQDATLPDFGMQMIVKGGNYNSAGVRLTDSFQHSFDRVSYDLGFRCVFEIPTRRETVESILSKS